MDEILGSGNSLLAYGLVLLIYAGLWIAMRQPERTVDPAFRKSFMVLYVVWTIGIFTGNYLFYRLNIMSFTPWLNNVVHSFIWIGLCLTFLYAVSYKRPLWEQLVLFVIFSFVVKLTEHVILGTWEFDHFFFIEGNLAYIIGWSIVDAAYPIGSPIALYIASRFITGVVTPKLPWN